jgi:MerR family transcriptional regulator/heat shock protein HspR
MNNYSDEPAYVISVVARMVGVHAQTLRSYERWGLVVPSRSSGNIRLYSQRDVALLFRIREMMEELGVNLAGVEVSLRMIWQMREMEEEVEDLKREVVRLRLLLGEMSITGHVSNTEN